MPPPPALPPGGTPAATVGGGTPPLAPAPVAGHGAAAPASLSEPRRWGVVLGAGLGLTAAHGPVALLSFGVLMKPLAEAYGWSRAGISLAASLSALLAALSIPFFGAAMDRWGVRRVMAPSIVLFALALAAAGLARRVEAFVGLLALAGVFGAVQTPPGYMKCVAAYFDRNRALAMGLAASGVGVGQMILPAYLGAVLARLGVAYAFPALGLAVLVLALSPMILLLRDPPPVDKADGPSAAPNGRTLGEALTTRAFWLLAAAILLASTVVTGSLVHAVPLLTDRGLSPAAAAGLMGTVGGATLAGRIGTGLLADRFFAPAIGAASFLLGLVGLVLLSSAMAPLTALVLLGLASGSEINLMGYLTSRYFGARAYGRIYGVLFGLFSLGAACGPLLMGLAFSRDHSYATPLRLFEVLLATAAALMLLLGRYPEGFAAPAAAASRR